MQTFLFYQLDHSTDLSSIPNASSANEEPESLEIKPLTPREPSSAAEPDSPQDSPRETPSEPRPSTFAFPSEDEPVTMISKSIPPSAVSASNRPSRMSQLERGMSDTDVICFVNPLSSNDDPRTNSPK